MAVVFGVGRLAGDKARSGTVSNGREAGQSPAPHWSRKSRAFAAACLIRSASPCRTRLKPMAPIGTGGHVRAVDARFGCSPRSFDVHEGRLLGVRRVVAKLRGNTICVLSCANFCGCALT